MDIKILQDFYYAWTQGYVTLSEIDDIRKCTSYYGLCMIMRARAKSMLDSSGGTPFYEPSTYYRGEYIAAAYHHDDYHLMGDRMASRLSSIGSDYWSDFDDRYGSHQFTSTKMSLLLEAYRETASLIVTALNKLKNGSWAYALCVKNMPNYDDHPLRSVILAEMASVGCDAAMYDETVALMREIQQDFYGAIQRYHAKKYASTSFP
jgi:hypothetical protein